MLAQQQKLQEQSPDYDFESTVKVQQKGVELFVTKRFVQHYANNGYESFSSDLFLSFLRPGDTFVDAGAHYGYYSLLAAKQIGNGHIIAIEAAHENLSLLKKNFAHSSLANFETHNVALTDFNGEVDFNIAAASDSCGIIEHPWTTTVEKRRVRAQTLDNLLAGRKVDLLKIDTEGNELQVLKGCRETIARNPEMRMMIEFNPKCLRVAGTAPERLLQELDRLNFDIYFCHDRKRQTYRLNPSQSNDWALFMLDHEYINIWCIPRATSLAVSFVSHSSDLGGAERSLLALCEEIANRGIFCHVSTLEGGPLVGRLKQLPVSVGTLSAPWPWIGHHPSSIETLLEEQGPATAQLVEQLSLINPHIIISNTSVIISGALAAVALGIPHVWDIREFANEDLEFLFDHSRRTDLHKALSNHIFFNSENTRQHYPQIGTNYSVTYPIIKVSKNDMMPRISDQPFRILMLGRITASKGQILAIRAFALFHARYPNSKLDLIGAVDNLYELTLQEEISRNKLENCVRCLPTVEHPSAELRNSDVLLHCAPNEPFGRVIVEGMLLGLPVIAARAGGSAEIITDRVDGMLFDTDDAKSLADTITTLYLDPALRGNLAQAAQHNADVRFSGERTADAVVHKLRELKGLGNNFFSAPDPDPIVTQMLALTMRSATRGIIDHRDALNRVGQALQDANDALSREKVRATEERNVLMGILNRKAVRVALWIANSKVLQSGLAQSVKATLRDLKARFQAETRLGV